MLLAFISCLFLSWVHEVLEVVARCFGEGSHNSFTGWTVSFISGNNVTLRVLVDRLRIFISLCCDDLLGNFVYGTDALDETLFKGFQLFQVFNGFLSGFYPLLLELFISHVLCQVFILWCVLFKGSGKVLNGLLVRQEAVQDFLLELNLLVQLGWLLREAICHLHLFPDHYIVFIEGFLLFEFTLIRTLKGLKELIDVLIVLMRLLSHAFGRKYNLVPSFNAFWTSHNLGQVFKFFIIINDLFLWLLLNGRQCSRLQKELSWLL